MLGDTGSKHGGTGCQCDMLSENIWFTWSKPSNHTGSVEGGTGWYSVVLGQNRAVLVASMTSFQKIYGLHGLDHQIIEYSSKEKVITDRHTHRHTDTQNFLL